MSETSSRNPPKPTAPYPGLRPFRQDEAKLFFGRDAQIDDVLARLKQHQFLGVVGTSGCGKSSLIRAGMLPALESGLMGELGSSWFIADMKPGDAPLTNLAKALMQSGVLGDRWSNTPEGIALLTAALRRSDVSLVNLIQQVGLPKYTNLLVLADQFEEVFRFQQSDPNEALAFVNLLLATGYDRSAPIYVVLTMRTDFLGQCALFPGLPEALNDAQYLCPRLTRDQLAEAIEGPASVSPFDADVEPALITQIVNDAGANSDQLPLVQHVLARMWHLNFGDAFGTDASRTDRVLRLEDYLDVGGLKGGSPPNRHPARPSGARASALLGPSEAAQMPLNHPDERCGESTEAVPLPASPGFPEELRSGNALSQHADEAYFELRDGSQDTGVHDPNAQPSRRQFIAQMLFRCLAERGPSGQYVRRPVKVQDVAAVAGCSVPEVIEVVEVFRREDRSFLVPPVGVTLEAQSVLDISHEALIRQWQRFGGPSEPTDGADSSQSWLSVEDQSRRRYRRLAEAADSEPTAGLLKNPELGFLDNWWQEFQPNEAWADGCVKDSFLRTTTFLARSRKAAQDEDQRQQAEQQKRLELAENLAEEQTRRAEAEGQRRLAEEARASEAERRERAAQGQAAQQRQARQLTVILAVTLLVAGVAIFSIQFQGQRDTGLRLVEALPGIETASVRDFAKGLKPYHRLINSRLIEMFEKGQRPNDKLHAALALLALDPGAVKYREFLVERLLEDQARPDELRVICEALGEGLGTLIAVEDKIQSILDRQRLDDYRELNAAGALAAFAPGDECWTKLGPLVAQRLTKEPVLSVEKWRIVFKQVAPFLLFALLDIYGNSNLDEQQRLVAYTLLFNYADSTDQDYFVELIVDASLNQFKILMPRLQPNRQRAVSLLATKLDAPSQLDKKKLALRQCRIAIALSLLGDFKSVSRVLKHSDDPTLRTELIHEFANYGVDVDWVIARLKADEDLSVKCALILALGEYENFQPDEELIRTLLRLYEGADPGIHGAVEWLLRMKWGKSKELVAINNKPSSRSLPNDRNWFVNGQEQTFAVIRDPKPFQMGSAPDGPSNETPQHWRSIGHSFAIATKEVTVGQYERFLNENLNRISKTEKEKGKDLRNPFPDPEVNRYISGKTGLIRDAPVMSVTWYEAAHYCNWLSKKEGIEESQWYYKPNAMEQYASEMAIASNDRTRTGYRLPTEAEWEYACRAGSNTTYPHGLITERLRSYAQYLDNESGRISLSPVGGKKPNDLGLFDIVGSVGEWVDDKFEKNYPTRETMPDDPLPDEAPVITLVVIDGFDNPRVRRGGNLPLAPVLRSASRNGNRPEGLSQAVGFRVARTISSP